MHPDQMPRQEPVPEPEPTVVVPVKFEVTIRVEQLDMAGINPWRVNGAYCKDKTEAMKAVTNLINGSGGNRAFLSNEQGAAEVLSWRKPFSLADVARNLDGFGEARSEALVKELVDQGKIAPYGQPGTYRVQEAG